jgi:hypothetical protein
MLDPMLQQRPGFRSGNSIQLADGQAWTVPEPDLMDDAKPPYEALLSAVAAADDRPELLRAELALGIHLIALNYELSPLILGALLDFPEGDPALADLQIELHDIAIEHVRAHRPAIDKVIAPRPAPRVARRLGLFSRVRAAMSA